MSDFSPIDHKESDPEYVALVRELVARQVGQQLLPIEDPTVLVGRWRSSLTLRSDGDYDVEHLEDGTFREAGEVEDSKPGRWKLKGDAYFRNRSRGASGTGPFFGRIAHFGGAYVDRKHGPVPLPLPRCGGARLMLPEHNASWIICNP